MINEFETFYDKIKVMGNKKQLYITIPMKITEFGGYKIGDQVKVMIQKKETE
jgi:hypothetical protein